jgi:hypothetical protein
MMISIAAMTSGALPLEPSAASSPLMRDLSDVLRAAGCVPPAVSVLADRAKLAVEIALREAAGRPDDERWYAAYDALKDFTIFFRRCVRRPDEVPSFVRLSKFLAENADLARTPGRPPHQFGRAFTHFFERS